MTSVSSTKNGSTKPVRSDETHVERDALYDLVSVLYHGLQGADQCSVFAEDADEAGDIELAEFLREAGRAQGQLAKRAKQLFLDRSPGRAAASKGRPQSAGEYSSLGDTDADDDSNVRDDD